MLCRVCGEDKSTDDRTLWHFVKARVDRCKSCWNLRMREYRVANQAKLRAYDTQRRLDDPAKFKAADAKRDPEQRRKNTRASYARNRDARRAAMKQRRIDNIEVARAVQKASYAKHAESNRQRARDYRKNNPDKISAQNRRRQQANPLSGRVVTAIHRHLRGAKDPSKTLLKYVDWSIEDLCQHLSTLFENGMNFDNAGTWHIDHVIPCSKISFDGADDPQFKGMWALSNLAPLWARDNISKKNSLNWQLPDSYRNPLLRAMYDNRDVRLLAEFDRLLVPTANAASDFEGLLAA